MVTNKITEVTIYESPDGGRTVYARRSGSTQRSLYSQSEDKQLELVELEQQKRWVDIFQERRNNPELDQLCEQVEIFYTLAKR